MRYWYYLADGTLFAPEAGQNHAFRDMIASRFGGKYSNFGPPTTQEQLYRQVREYRDRYPDIALVPMENGAGPLPILMGGGVSQSSTRTVRTMAQQIYRPTPSSTNSSTNISPKTS